MLSGLEIILLCLVCQAAASDLAWRRVPNVLVLAGLLLALALHWRLGGGNALLGQALAGAGVGLLLFLPMYALGGMAAGDVKLMAMVGSFLGPAATCQVVIFVFITGGLAAISYALWHRMAGKLLRNSAEAVQLLYINVAAGIAPDARSSSAHSVGTLPYGVSIALGTLAFLVARQFTWV